MRWKRAGFSFGVRASALAFLGLAAKEGYTSDSGKNLVLDPVMTDRPPNRETPVEQKRSLWLQFGRYSQLAFALPAATIAGYLVGSQLDRWLHTSWISVVGLFLGIAAGLVEVIRTASRDMR
ncbi:MAG TPA: AtpZ/AtpI family protein [Candidatus Sulfotelmatobacter sp.]